MKDFREFVGKFSWRVLTLVGVVAMAQSVPVQYIAHSSALKFGGQWVGPVCLVALMGVELGLPLHEVHMAKNLVVRSPFQPETHIRLAVAAAGGYDYDLAEKEYSEAERLRFAPKDVNVLGAASEVELKIFPAKFLQEEIEGLKTKLNRYPGDRNLLLVLAARLWQLGKDDDALAMWQKAEVLDPNYPAVGTVGKVLGIN